METENQPGPIAQIDHDGADGSIDITPATSSNSLSTQPITYSITLAKIGQLAEKYKEVPADLTVKANYDLVKKAASHLRGLRTDVEKRRKELKADALEFGKRVDGAAKELTERLVAIEEPFSTAKKEHDTAVEIAKREAALAEERRVDGIAEKIAFIKSRVEAHISSSSADIKTAIVEIDNYGSNLPEWAMEFAEKASATLIESRNKLVELYDMKLQQETIAQQLAEAEERRKAEEEAARIQREKEIAEQQEKIAAERAAMEVERAAMAKAAEELAAIQRAKDEEHEAIAKAERDRLAKEKEELEARLKAEQDARDSALKEEQEKAAKIQAEKDAAAEAERAKLAAEIEALKKAQAPEPEKVPEAVVVEEQPVKAEVTTSANIDTASEEYRAAGNAMLKIIGVKVVAKLLLHAIIKNEIPNIRFTGEV